MLFDTGIVPENTRSQSHEKDKIYAYFMYNIPNINQTTPPIPVSSDSFIESDKYNVWFKKKTLTFLSFF